MEYGFPACGGYFLSDINCYPWVREIRQDCIIAWVGDCLSGPRVNPWFLYCYDVVLLWSHLLEEGGLDFVVAMVGVVLYYCDLF